MVYSISNKIKISKEEISKFLFKNQNANIKISDKQPEFFTAKTSIVVVF
jgi:hypothetical protein